ncbi:hypothetical protein J23TS9_42660 [Paenibacillus sp. J23TS9]|uniref:hypothetical protein n=1 Tax=Paenibacillus sp. J23TS9 TaxID=2807193 RepID=UPI001B163E37|nr:hypothetical protein [Paenibacillus sp. J23TS9]GIP29136.1 hypothetical protein J23TS9_42660 [Paenibacillus sp. J23TS9]
MSNKNRIAQLTEQADQLLEQVEASQNLLTGILLHVDKHSLSLNISTAFSVALEAHCQFAKADRKLLKCRLRLIYERSGHDNK